MSLAKQLPEPLGPMGTVSESGRQTLLQLLLRRAWLWMGLLLAAHWVLGTVLTQLPRVRLDGSDLYCLLAWWSLATVVVPWVAMYLGVQSVHGEIEDRTVQYLFLRPVHRAWILVGKWLVVSLVTCALATVCAFVLLHAVGGNRERWVDGFDAHLAVCFAQVLSCGVFAYTAVAMTFACTFRRPLAWAAFFVVGVQMLVANLPVSAGLRCLTITDPMRRRLFDLIEPDQQLVGILWPADRRLNEQDLGAPLQNLFWLGAVCLAFACWRYARSEYESRNRD